MGGFAQSLANTHKMTEVSFDSLPQAINEVLQKLSRLEKAISEQANQPAPDQWLTLDELVGYDPAKRAKQTFYGLVSRGEIPFHKSGKKLTFLKSEIDAWLRSKAQGVSIDRVEN